MLTNALADIPSVSLQNEPCLTILVDYKWRVPYKIHVIWIYNVYVYLTILQIWFFNIQLLLIHAIYKSRTIVIWVPDTKEMCYYYEMRFPFLNGTTNQIILDNTLKPRKNCIIVLKPERPWTAIWTFLI